MDGAALDEIQAILDLAEARHELAEDVGLLVAGDRGLEVLRSKPESREGAIDVHVAVDGADEGEGQEEAEDGCHAVRTAGLGLES